MRQNRTVDEDQKTFAPALLARVTKRPIEMPALRALAPVAAARRATSPAAAAVEVVTASQGAASAGTGARTDSGLDGKGAEITGSLLSAGMIRLSSGVTDGASGVALAIG